MLIIARSSLDYILKFILVDTSIHSCICRCFLYLQKSDVVSDLAASDEEIMTPGFCDRVVAKIMAIKEVVDTRKLIQNKLIPCEGKQSSGSADRARSLMRQLARLGFGSIVQGRQARSLIFKPNTKLTEPCQLVASAKKGKK